MNVVDSSGWLEYFADGGNADFFAPAIEDTKSLLVPVICLYEVFKKILQQSGINEAQVHVSDMKQGKIIELDESLALSAAKLSADLKLPMADSLILATARANDAVLWTQDEHFKDLDGVKYIEKK
ncbi:MAG: type II toxin-antitoxin system VapC family toxin [Chloroflexota bacterium]|nr:type II toxin-antitoxin system VapC family toxin [Chloroflexota bacterium]MBI5705199.1 type II toxin-antitoxin system VapC family toxin [Chloroflexota bacterium]